MYCLILRLSRNSIVIAMRWVFPLDKFWGPCGSCIAFFILFSISAIDVNYGHSIDGIKGHPVK